MPGWQGATVSAHFLGFQSRHLTCSHGGAAVSACERPEEVLMWVGLRTNCCGSLVLWKPSCFLLQIGFTVSWCFVNKNLQGRMLAVRLGPADRGGLACRVLGKTLCAQGIPDKRYVMIFLLHGTKLARQKCAMCFQLQTKPCRSDTRPRKIVL